jgi:hypothetical protein
MATVGGRPRREDHGFGLLEVILSLTVLLMVLIASSYLVDNVVQQAAFNRQRVAAAELAEQYLETTSNASLTSLQADISKDVLLTATPVSVGGVNYSVWSHLEWAGTGSAPTLCASGNPPQVVRATMTVKWGNGQSLGETSVLDPPYGTVIPGDGFLSIRLYGGNLTSAPSDTPNLINVAVNVYSQSTGTTTTYNPDQNGCVYLQEPLGKYLVTLGSPTGGPSFIDYQENATPSVPVTATPQTYTTLSVAGIAVNDSFYYDEAGTVTLSPSASAPVPAGLPVSVGNSSLQPSGTAVVVPYGSSTSSVSLFPYTLTGYSVWYGDCTTHATVTKEQPSGPTTFSLTPRGSATPSITGLDTLAVTATRTGGAAFSAAPTPVTATINDSGAPTDGCPSGDNNPTGSTSLAGNETYSLAGFAPTTTGSTTSYTSQTAVMPQTYIVKITDPTNSSTTSFTMTVGTTGVTYGATTYPFGTPVPVVVS